MSQRNSIEIDYCPQCRGIWLDRGELDKIIERSALERRDDEKSLRYASDRRDDRRYDSDDGYKYKKRKKSFLEELFD